MNAFLKIVSFAVCLLVMASAVSCGGEKNEEENKKTSQKVYNTAFQQATTAVPNSTTGITEATTVTETQADTTVPTTKKRTGKRGNFKQTADMRKISSKQLLTEMGAGITLGDSFTANGLGEDKTVEEYETYFENPVVTKELIEAYAKAGFTAVRIPVSWTDHIDEKGVVDELWLDRIEEVAGYVLDSGMYCIINSQNDQSWLTVSNAGFDKTKSKFTAMWKSIANRFISYNDHLIFEGVSDILKADNDKSEPDETDLKNANAVNQAFVKAVRSTGKNNAKRHLIVSTYGAFISSTALDGFKLPNDTAKDKLIAKVNLYVPSSFCLEQGKKQIWGSSEDKAYLDSALAVINHRFESLNVPCIIGEFGAVDKGNTSARVAFAKYVVSTAYNYYMVCFWNDNGENMGLISRNTYEILHKKITNSIIESAK